MLKSFSEMLFGSTEPEKIDEGWEVVKTNDYESQGSGVSTPIEHTDNGHEPWSITPPPIFTGRGQVAHSPLENRLIEHPSMSVYHEEQSASPLLDRRASDPNPLQELVDEEEEERPRPQTVVPVHRREALLTSPNELVLTRRSQRLCRQQRQRHNTRANLKRANQLQSQRSAPRQRQTRCFTHTASTRHQQRSIAQRTK